MLLLQALWLTTCTTARVKIDAQDPLCDKYVCWCWCRCCCWWWCYSWKGWGVILFTMHFPCVPDGNNSALVHDKWRMTSHHLIQYWHCRRRIYKSTVGQALHVVGLTDDMFWKTKEFEIDMKQCVWINTAIRFYIKTILICLYDLYSRYKIPIQGLYSLSGKTSYRKISWSLEAARFGFKLFQSLWNLAGTSAALLPMCLSNFRAIRPLQHPISRLRDFTRFGDKTSYRLVNRGPE